MSADIVIVGAGPAGLATALFLVHRAPHLASRLEVVDRAHFPREKPCAGAIGARADALLRSIGVTVDVPSAPVHGLSVRFQRGEAERSVGDIGRVVRRLEFDAELLRVARARGVQVSEGVRVTSLAPDAEGVTVETSAGPRRAAVVIGADGVGSVVRRALGFPRGGLHAQAIEVDTAMLPGESRAVMRFDFSDERLVGYGWDFPTLVDGVPLMCRGVYDLDWDDGGGADVAERLTRSLGARGLPVDPSRFKRYAVRGLELHRPMSAPRVLLVGEAAGVDPLLGEGIAQGLAYGALAARYVADALEARRFDFADWASVFRRSPTFLDLAARSAVLPVLRRPALRRALEDLTLGAPEALDVTTSAFAGRAPPLVSLASAFVKLNARAALLPARAALRALRQRQEVQT